MRKTAVIYLCFSLFCGFFSYVYEHFSHGVFSGCMTFLFLFPLLGGALPFGALVITGQRVPGVNSARLYHSGIATLTAGSCMSGVLEIYGTASPYIPVYWIIGSILIVIGFTLYLAAGKIQKSG